MTRKSRNKKRRYNRKKVLFVFSTFIVLIFIVLITSFLIFKKNSSSLSSKSMFNTSKNTKDITISAVGDIMVHDSQLKAQFNIDNNKYSFNNNFKHVKPYLSKSDLSIANLETTLAGQNNGYSAFPRFNSPDELADALKNSGIDILSTINNHAYDSGSNGVYRTLDVLKSKGFKTIGTKLQSEKNNYLIENIDGIKLGVTSFTYGEIFDNKKSLNGLSINPNDFNNLNIFSSNNVDKAFTEIKSTLDNISKNNPDLKVLVLHWGNEYDRVPNDFQNELAKRLCDYGVDIIIGSHPHMVQPIELIKSTKNNNETLVIYSLGNFLSNQRNEILKKEFTEDGVIVNINISKNLDTNKTNITDVEYIPTWVNKFTDKNNKLSYEIIPIIKNTLSEIENLPLNKVENSYKNTTSIIQNSDFIKVKN